MPPRAKNYDPTGIEYHTIPDFKFTDGKTLDNVKVAYRSYNAASTAGVVLIPTCFSGWINTTLTFTGGSDGSGNDGSGSDSSGNDNDGNNGVLSRYHVVVAAMLGNGESSSPSNEPAFPAPGELRYEDVIRAHHHLLRNGLGVTQLEAVIGFSMGGQQTYHWAVMYPKFVKRVVAICGSARTSPHNYAFLDGPISSLVHSVDYVAWKEAKANATKEKGQKESAVAAPRRGLIAFGRTYCAWITSAEWFRARNWRKMNPAFRSVEDYIRSQGEGKLGWDADDLLVLARMWQMADIGKTARGELTQLVAATITGSSDRHVDDNGDEENDANFQTALAAIPIPVLLLPCRYDQYFRPEDNAYEMQFLKHGRLEVIESVWGHAAGGGANPDDVAFMAGKIKEFMAA